MFASRGDVALTRRTCSGVTSVGTDLRCTGQLCRWGQAPLVSKTHGRPLCAFDIQLDIGDAVFYKTQREGKSHSTNYSGLVFGLHCLLLYLGTRVIQRSGMGYHYGLHMYCLVVDEDLLGLLGVTGRKRRGTFPACTVQLGLLLGRNRCAIGRFEIVKP